MVNEVANILKDFTPSAAGIWTLVVMVLVYGAREIRENRKLSAEDRLARREGYAKQVEGLQAENRDLRREMQSDREEYDNYRKLCQIETDQLRRDIIQQEHRLVGLRRRVDTLSRDIIKVATGRDVELEIVGLLAQFEQEEFFATGESRSTRAAKKQHDRDEEESRQRREE